MFVDNRSACAAAAVSVSALLAACGSSGAFKPTEVNAFGTPYEGLSEAAYGPLSTGRFRFCDPADDYANNPNIGTAAQAPLGDATHALAATVTGVIGTPLQGLMKVDARLMDLQLVGHFKVPYDSNFPQVAVLADSPNGITFWHSAKVVRLYEVAAAAQDHCARQAPAQKKAALYRGSASRCPPVERGFQGMPVISTYAISAFACAAPGQAPPPRR